MISPPETRLHQALSDTGECSFGIVAIEAFVINDKKTRLVRPEGAWWRDPFYPPAQMDESLCRQSLRNLEDPSANGYIKAQDVQPGVGLVGQLWAEKTIKTIRSNDQFPSGSFRESLSESYRNFFLKLKSQTKGSQFIMYAEESLIWRGLEFANSDPDQIPDNRLKTFINAGIGMVAGVPFELPNKRGIVLYYSNTRTKLEGLTDKRNEEFLIRSASLIGSILALSDSMTASWEAKQEELAVVKAQAGDIAHVIEKDKSSPDIESISVTTGSSDPSNDPVYERRTSWCLGAVCRRFVMLKDKTFDSHETTKPPPTTPNVECIWTFMGSFLTIIAISYTAEYIPIRNSAMPLPPFGAFLTLLYGLTSAPASQPRNAIYGSSIAGCIALTISYIPEHLVNLRISLAASLSITLMARLGVIHPPAGALAILLSINDHYDWISLLLYMMGSLIAIAIAIVVNNLNEKRMYPQYWRLV